jgi:hypothetical protein
VGGEQGEAEREGGRGEHGQSLGQDVGDGVGLEEVGVELVAMQRNCDVSMHLANFYFVKKAEKPLCIECNGIAMLVFRYSKFSTTPFVTGCQVIGNVYEEVRSS